MNIEEKVKKIVEQTLNDYINHEDNRLDEMARVGFLNGGVEVYIHTDDGGSIPHIHIRDVATRGRNFETCVSLVKCAYFLHGRYRDTMSNKMVRAFAEFMEAPSRNKKYSSNYEYAVDMWNDNNSNINVTPQYDTNGNIIIPNYRYLND